jgi:hypothetical protein
MGFLLLVGVEDEERIVEALELLKDRFDVADDLLVY